MILGSKPLITSNFPSHPLSYPSVHIDAFNHALKKSRGSELEPVLWVNTLGNGAGLCHVEREGLRFLVPVGQEGAIERSCSGCRADRDQ